METFGDFFCDGFLVLFNFAPFLPGKAALSLYDIILYICSKLYELSLALYPYFRRDTTMIKDQTKNRVTRNLSNIAQNAARRTRRAFLLPGILVLLVTACSAAAPASAQPPVATTAPINAVSNNATAATQAPANTSGLPQDPLAAVDYALRTQPKSLPFKETTTIGSGATQMVTSVVIETP